MAMTEQELRALVREAVARHLGGPAPAGAGEPRPLEAAGQPLPAWRHHISHGVYLTLSGGGDACLIEPAVPCSHCAYCQSHGH